MLYNFLKILLSPIVRSVWLRRVYGAENIPAAGPYLLAVNHESNLDPLIISSVFPLRLYYLTGEKFYKFAIFRYLMNHTEQIYVDRTAKDKTSVFAESREHLAKGHVVAIFPEGTRTRSGHIEKAYLGVAKIALQNKVDILPAAISGTFEDYPPGKTFPNFSKNVEMRFLPVIKYEDIKDMTEETIVHGLVMPQIAAANGEEYHHEA